MWRLKITKYKIKGIDEKTNNPVEVPYDFVTTTINIMMHPVQQLTPAHLLKRNKIAIQMESAVEKGEEFVILEDEEINEIQQSISEFKGMTRAEVELIDRIQHPEKVKVKEVEPEKAEVEEQKDGA